MTEMILTSSVLILLLALLRRVLRGRIDPRVQYALWLLAAARLLIPGSLFTAPVSVLGATRDLQTALHETFPDPDELPEPVINGILDQLDPVQPAQPAGVGHPDGDTVVVTHPVVPAITQRVYNWPNIIWKTGMLLTGGALVLSNLAFFLRLRRRRKRLDLPAAPWSGGLPVYEASGLTSPCLSGLLRPAIYLNEAAMDAEHPEHILAHEYAHYRHGDHVWSLLRCVCLAVHWYNPLVWWAAALSRRDCELACDAAALNRLGEAERIDYGQTLLGMVSKKSSPAALFHTATTMTAGKRAMAERVALIVKQPKTKKITICLVILTACLLAACAFAGGEAKPDGTEPSPLTSEEAALLEFPGLHWNDSVETVMETLGITEEDFIDSSNDNSDTRNVFSFAVEDVPFYGYTAQYVICRFMQYGENELGLYSVQVSYPDDMEDFSAIREELLRQYGPAGKEECLIRQIQPSWKNRLGDRYDRWVELQQQPDVNTVSWDLDPETLPEGMIAPFEREFRLSWQNSHPEDTLEDYLDQFPIGRLTWCGNSSFLYAPTFNTVTFDGGGYVYCLQNVIGNELLENARDVVTAFQGGGDALGWLPYMAYMDWDLIRQAAVEAGMDEGDGSGTAVNIIGAITQYVEDHGASMTMAEYLYILSATEGLDGAVAEGYSYMIYRMHAVNPGAFAYVVLEQLPEEQQGEVLDLFRYEYRYEMSWNHRPLDGKDAPTRAEMIHELEADLAQALDQEITEIIFHSPGESAQYRFVGAQGVGAASFESENPEVATVNDIGLIVAEAPGETDIKAHYEGNGVQKDFVCHIVCEW